MNASVYFFDEHQQLLSVVKEDKLLEVIQEKEITANQAELIKDTLNVTLVYEEKLKNSAYMAVKEEDKTFSFYRIAVDSESENKQTFTGISFAPDELDSYIIQDYRPKNEAIKTTLTKLIQGTEWRLGYAEAALPAITDTFYYVSVKEALKQLQTHGCEILFKYEIKGSGISDKWIEVYQKIGKHSNKRFTYGDKVLDIVREQDRNQVYTSLIGRGRGEDVGDGYGKRLDFSSVVWQKSAGDPVDKPKGQAWVELPEMTKLYGIPLKNGTMRRREKVIQFDDEDDAKNLLQRTYQSLVEYSRPLVQFKTQTLESDSLGNTVTIHRYDRNYHYRTRIFKVKINRLSGKTEASLGDNITKSISKAASDLKGAVTAIDEKKMSFYDSEEISKWQDDIIRGAKGGSIMLMNQQDLGKGDSREPYQQVFMNGDSLETSNHFLVMNSDGIGFIEGDFHKNKAHTAWTIDGQFNADYIKTGTLEGVTLKTKSNQLFQVVISSKGSIKFLKNGEEELGRLFATLSGSTGQANGYALLQRKGYIFSINSKSENDESSSRYVIQIPKESTADDPKINSRGVWNHSGDLRITGKLIVNGIEISGNGNGGSGGNPGSGYPPEVTTQADKFAWDLWSFLLANGYSKAAAAGILGNVQQETGGTMDPDTDQIGGPAYGLVQWDGSMYPLIGNQTWDGREYVQRLIAAASITDDYKSTVGQAKLIEWSMYNGQWLGAVSPTSVTGFKAVSDPAVAAYAFEMNFERPKNAHPERQGYALEWYNKFKDLKPSTGTGTGKAGLDHLESLIGRYWGNGECYAVSAEFSGYLGGCGLGAGTQYGLSHVIGDTNAAADIGSSYNWSAVGWKVIYNPSYDQLVTGAIINWKRGGNAGGFNVDYQYGHTGVIKGLANGRIQTYEQNAGKGRIVAVYDRAWVASSEISSIVIPPK
ncbi:phage tail spike protein [Enterococcus sp. LJL51]|uniref:phage tail spike protein n=1 Tax=Enterococcus sp. LJL51 TaxID=3416656 RepID=UPI003CFB1C64